MHMFQLRLGLTALALGALLVPAFGQAQEVEVVSKEIAVGRDEAALRLEFSNDLSLDVSLKDGSVFIDSEPVGSYQAGDELDAAWRALLGQAVALDDGPLSSMLVDWSPPASLTGESLDLAMGIDDALEAALSMQAAETVAEAPDIQFSFGEGNGNALLRVLLSQIMRLGVFEDALAGLEEGFQIHFDEDVEILEGETVEGSLVSIQGDVRIAGTVNGDVVVVDGTLELLPGSRIHGEVRLADARMVRNAGTVDGDVVDVLEDERFRENEIRVRLREELRSEMGAATRSGDGRSSSWSPFTAVVGGVAGVFQNLVAILILGLVGLGVIAMAGKNMEAVAETARRSPGRSAMVGVAGTFLLLPVWVLGTVALAVSIVGIPVMIAWLPLFPLAAVAAAILGYVSVARNTGEWLADSEYRFTDWIRKSNPVYTIAGGLVGLMAFFIAANILSIVPFFGFFRGLLGFAGVVVTVVAIQIGFGAVLLTRGGRRPEYYPTDDLDAAWEAAMDVDVDATPAGNGGEQEKKTDA